MIDLGKVFDVLIESVMELIRYISSLWDWLNTDIKLVILGMELFNITPIKIIGGVGLTALIVLWFVRG